MCESKEGEVGVQVFRGQGGGGKGGVGGAAIAELLKCIKLELWRGILNSRKRITAEY